MISYENQVKQIFSSIICGWNLTTSLGPAYAHVNFLSNFTQMKKKNPLLVPVGELHKYMNRVRPL